MKYLIASDIHGSGYYAKELLRLKDKENADRVILLGDIYNHGPRNPLPKDYDPMAVSQSLNSIKDELIVIKGNCDSDVDTLISDFDFIPHLILDVNNKTVFLTHGDVYNKSALPKMKIDAIIYGHFHTGFIERLNNTVVANTGSMSLPKLDTENSYIVLENGVLTLKSVDGKILDKIEI